MKRIRKCIACALCGVLAATSFAVPALAAEGTTKDESVYITLKSDGAVDTQTVSDWLHSDSGLANFQDTSCLTDITNLKGTDMPTRDGKNLVWNVNGNDVYYQGTTQLTPPITAEITYTLDGSAISAEDLAGKSGHLVIGVHLTNNVKKQRTDDGKSRTVYTPFVTAVGADLPVDSFTNIKAENGTVQTDSQNQLVGFVCLPGMAKNFDGILSEEFSSVQDKFLDDVAIEADVTNAEVPSLIIAYASDASLLSGSEDLSKFTDLTDELNGLTDALNELADGAKKLADGSASLASGASDLKNGTSQLASGAAALKNGTSSLASGASSLASGAADLNSGLSALNGKSAALNAGAQQVADGVLANANTQFLATAPAGTPALTWANYASVLGSLSSVSDPMREQAKQQISASSGVTDPDQLNALLLLASQQGLSANPTTAECTAAVQAAGAILQKAAADSAASGSIGAAKAALQTAGGNPVAVASVQAVLQNVIAADPTTYGAITDPTQQLALAYQNSTAGISAAVGGDASLTAVLFTMACNSVASGAAADVPTAVASAQTDLTNAQTASAALTKAANNFAADAAAGQAVTGFLTQSVMASSGASINAAASLLSTLQSVNTFVQGVSAYTGYVGQAAAGSAKIVSGAQQLASGAAALDTGTASLNEGASKLDSGAATLNSGAQQVASGAQKLSDGISEGMDKLPDESDIEDLQAVADVAAQMKEQAEDYTSYTGAPAGISASVKFVMKTPNIKAPDTKATSDSTDTAATQTTEKVSFWTRIRDLFRRS